MTTETFFGCHFTEVWASPADWKTTTSKKSLDKDWYVQCYFFDPKFKEKYPRGFPFRKKLNKIPTLEQRREAIQSLMLEIPKLLQEEGFNPITKLFMKPKEETASVYDHTTSLKEALNLASTLYEVSGHTKADIKSTLKYFMLSAEQLNLDTLEIGRTLSRHIKIIMDNIYNVKSDFSDKRYNKYAAYLSPLFEILIDNDMINNNPTIRFRRKKTVTNPRTTLTMAERIKVNGHLQVKDPRFWLFMQIFFHSGGRENELVTLRYEDISFFNLEYTTIVRKGRNHRIVSRPIKEIALPFWEKAVLGAQKGDFIFSVGFLPGPTPIRADQIGRRWKRLVKDELGIKADFYSLKHINLTEISAQISTEAAARAAGHTTTKMVIKHYDVGYKDREAERIKRMENHFVPKIRAV